VAPSIDALEQEAIYVDYTAQMEFGFIGGGGFGKRCTASLLEGCGI
tara:strand:+ start:191 stop:328 length:138 start_codon:yes stop_codon:yes gene_type:complete